MNILSSLRYLLALHEHRHFGRAAQACHITQPALSNAIKALEADLKVVIVRRDRNFVGLTPEGERVLQSAQSMLREFENLQQDLQSDSGLPQGPLRLAAVPTAIPIAARFAAMLHARYSGIRPVVLSLSSLELERGLEDLSIDLALGYAERMGQAGPPVTTRVQARINANANANAGPSTGSGAGDRSGRLHSLSQYDEHYFLLRRAAQVQPEGLQIGTPLPWRDAAQLPLCLLTADMHNRTIVDAAFRQAGVAVAPAMESNSIMTMMLAVADGNICSVLPGALLATLRGYRELEALPLTGPDVRTAISWMHKAQARPSRALEAGLRLASDPAWLRHAAAHSGLMGR